MLDRDLRLFREVCECDETTVEALIISGANVNAIDEEGGTPLFYAVWNGNEKIIPKLIECGADINAKDNDGKTALVYAMWKENKSMVEKLKKYGADVNAKDKNDSSPLHYAAWNNKKSIITTLIKCGADINATDEDCATPLFYAVRKGNEEVVKKLIEEGDTQVDARDRYGRTPLFYAMTQSLSLATYLLDKGASLHLKEDCSVLTFLIEKCFSSLPEKETQLRYGLNLLSERKDVKEKTILEAIASVAFCKILHFKPRSGDIDVDAIRALMRLAKEKSSTKLPVGKTKIVNEISRLLNKECHDKPLIEYKAVLELAQLLIKLGANANTKDSDGNTALHHATQLAFHGVSQESVMEICQQLEELNVSCHKTNHEDETPLLYCLARTIEKLSREQEPWQAVKTQAAVCRFLVEHGSSVEAKTGSGESVLHLAIRLLQQGFYKDTSKLRKDIFYVVLELLEMFVLAFRREEVSINIQDKSGNTPLHLWAKLELEPDQDYSTVKRKDFNILTRKSLSVILQDKEQLNSKNGNGETPLHLCRTLAAVELLLKEGANPNEVDSLGRTPLHICCRNIVEVSKSLSTAKIKTTVHCSMIKLLRSHGADYRISDGENQSCLDIAWDFPAVKELLMGKIDLDRYPVLIKPWKSVSKKHGHCLAKVARHLESEHVESYWYHKDQLSSGSFGDVFAGINEKDGREVAIKRIVKKRMDRPQDRREIKNLTALAGCEQVVLYVQFFEDKHFSYIVLELMEGNLDELLDQTITEDVRVQLCRDVVMGLKYLHNQNILHRDLKPTNILYKRHPKLCLKIADFGLSRRIDSTRGSTTVYGANAGTRCWISSEVLTYTKPHSKSSDMFACGLVLHYILSVKQHPFAPRTKPLQHETEANMLEGNMEGWNNSLCPEASHLLKAMLDGDKSKRPFAAKALDHPFFWSKNKKLDLLNAVGNQKEFGFPRARRTLPLTAVETDLETSFGTIVKYVDWNDAGYVNMPAIYAEMTTRRRYNTNSVVELVRFIRNAYAHVTALPKAIQDQLLKDFVFFEYFPNLLMEVYKAVTTHRWDQTREEIKVVI